MLVNGLKVRLPLLFFLLLLASPSCMVNRHGASAETKPLVKKSVPHDNGWWKAAFVFTWPEDEEPLWHLDLLIAHQVIGPVLRHGENQIGLWRFHRRAVRDDAGHRFSFIFYSSASMAQKIFHAIRANSDLQAMKASGRIIADVYDDTSEVKKPGLKDCSDPNWPEAIRKTWPYFINGVSRTWLELVEYLAQENKLEKEGVSPLEQRLSFYRDINGLVETLWLEEGGHAFLHHLNGVFGYSDVIIYEKRSMSF